MSVEKAVSYYKNKTGPVKMNCGQAVLAAFKDRFSLEDGIIMEFSSYGSGKAPDGECGAFHAAKRILGSGCAEKIKECEAFFADKAGATKCKEIRKLRKITCVGCVETASSFIENVECKGKDMKNMQSNRNGIQKMPPQDIAKDLAGNPKLKILDIRSPVDFGSAYIEGSINIPLESLAARASELIKPGNDYVVVCRMGNKAVTAADILHRSGAECVMVMEGGITRWQKDKLPVIKGKTGISLERQTRMIAGSMVVFGVLMGLLSHWAFSLVALFAGCGLVFAGVTDNCLMGVLLMKLPYNKKLYGTSSGCAGACSTTCG